ncbi:hypothetical protein SAMN04488020_102245 [Palleronia marisminoris]|uniref:Uncharacterized protein n=1 Tax=Palleronia marisminoris TaxID=315423 RepID=A0A1Y5RVZ8_9RHOB|nr:hypothetical protein [Palleronia marisminoris]SFG44131.1 hypothetical protein SAMN04488020_102245 [Palleronia marisminoris]SLN26705.1 hypothetical protein PAM7066_01036 [Palleronia marisminoris]
MKRTIAATALALVALSAPAFAQTAPTSGVYPVPSPASAQQTRDSNGFRIADVTSAHSPRVQKIFDELRAEKGTGTTH